MSNTNNKIKLVGLIMGLLMCIVAKKAYPEKYAIYIAITVFTFISYFAIPYFMFLVKYTRNNYVHYILTYYLLYTYYCFLNSDYLIASVIFLLPICYYYYTSSKLKLLEVNINAEHSFLKTIIDNKKVVNLKALSFLTVVALIITYIVLLVNYKD